MRPCTILERVAIALALLVVAPAQLHAATQRRAVEATRSFRVSYPASSARVVLPVAHALDGWLDEAGTVLGAPSLVRKGKPIEVIVAADHASFRAAQPAGPSLDPWAAGTAYPSLALIILSLEPGEFFSLAEIARHEVAHIALHRAVGGRPVPRWMTEGFAMAFSGEAVVGRWRQAAGAALAGHWLPFRSLSHGFPGNSARAALAYAQSAAFFSWLAHPAGPLPGGIGAWVRRIRAGDDATGALESLTGASLEELERRWAASMVRRGTWIHLLTDGGLLWAGMAVLFVWAWVVARRRRRERIRRMPDVPPPGHWRELPLD